MQAGSGRADRGVRDVLAGAAYPAAKNPKGSRTHGHHHHRRREHGRGIATRALAGGHSVTLLGTDTAKAHTDTIVAVGAMAALAVAAT
jgi:hypothetical protein